MRQANQPSIREISISAPGAGPYGSTTGPDAALWIILVHTGGIVRPTVDGHLNSFQLDDPASDAETHPAPPARRKFSATRSRLAGQRSVRWVKASWTTSARGRSGWSIQYWVAARSALRKVAASTRARSGVSGASGNRREISAVSSRSAVPYTVTWYAARLGWARISRRWASHSGSR